MGVASEFPRASLELGAATAFDFLLTVHQIGEKAAQLQIASSAL